MSLATVHTRAQIGISAPPVTVEVHLSGGLPGLTMVGLPEAAVKESRERVRSALLNSHFEFPARRITINLAPADLPKDGGSYDLAIAMGILVASEQLPGDPLAESEFLGELALGGQIRPISGVIPAGIASKEAGSRLFIPSANGPEAALIDHPHCLLAPDLLTLCAHLRGEPTLEPPEAGPQQDQQLALDLAEVKGQNAAKRALEVAACGNHNLLFFGPPGTGKTLLAERMASILPPLSQHQAIEVASVYSVANTKREYWQTPPFRKPHHSASAVAMVGGGSSPRPGEISLAHNGVLFLDELPEFQRQVLEVMREPLESGHVDIARASRKVSYPANFQLIGAMNPCPCGHFPEPHCRCTPDQVRRYRGKLSGPLLDRIDIHVAMTPMPASDLQRLPEGESSAEVQARVVAGRRQQLVRQGCNNAQLSGKALSQHARLTNDDSAFIEAAAERLGLSARAFHRIIRLARTAADLAGAANIERNHLIEALSYRQLDRKRAL